MVLIPLALVMDDDQNQLLAATGDVLALFLRQLELAWSSERHHHDYWCVEELLQSLRYLAKLDANKTCLKDKGVVAILTPILRDGSDLEQQRAAEVMWELAFDPGNSQHIQSDDTLRLLLETSRDSRHPAVSDKAKKTLWTVQQTTTADMDTKQGTSEQPVLDELLQPLQNVMQILRVGPAEMVLNMLNASHDQGHGQAADSQMTYTRGRLLRAALELMRKDEKHAQDFVDKGLLTHLETVLHSGKVEEEERRTIILILKTLVCGKHVKDDDQTSSQVQQLLSAATKTENADLPDLSLPLTACSGQQGVAVASEDEVGETRERPPSSGLKTSVYVSCHPQDRAAVLQVQNHLEQQQYTVHMSCDMSAQTECPGLEVMARAIRDSRIVLLCLSASYKASAHCRIEAEYAAQQDKRVVGVCVEKGYHPGGWLATLVNNKAHGIVDTANSACWEHQLSRLLTEM